VHRLLRRGGTALLAVAAVSVLAWFALPDDTRVAIHFGPSGADRWVGKGEAVLAVPAGMVFVLAIGLAVTAQAVRSGDDQPLAVPVIIASLWFLVGLHTVLLAVPATSEDVVPHLVAAGLGAVLVVAGTALRRPIARSRTGGVRTPATMRDAGSWRRGNRAAGEVLLAAGVVLVAVSAFVPLVATASLAVVGCVVAGARARMAAGSAADGRLKPPTHR